jgi:GDP/UDP-N,N'-diacetylbacillosamine 2-epimerase (hydrolysing)
MKGDSVYIISEAGVNHDGQRDTDFSLMDAVVGNSSSGLTEAPSFKIGTVNIGDRQRGRLQASSVINCEPKQKSIAAAVERLYSQTFQAGLSQARNPYGEGGSSEKILETIKHYSIDGIAKKAFYDLPAINMEKNH